MSETERIYISPEIYDRLLNLCYGAEIRSVSELAEKLIEKTLDDIEEEAEGEIRKA